ncbi:MAG: hypothetical protein LBC03_02050 [Nitrososphaerota archaeon]|jgi:hypothetical protein|nr:hypothetical protein [Nitrososphaerota archaeon]
MSSDHIPYEDFSTVKFLGILSFTIVLALVGSAIIFTYTYTTDFFASSSSYEVTGELSSFKFSDKVTVVIDGREYSFKSGGLIKSFNNSLVGEVVTIRVDHGILLGICKYNLVDGDVA